MGYGLPAAVGAKRLLPDRTVVCFAGDGDFMMHGQELATATGYGAKRLISVVVDNTAPTAGTLSFNDELLGMDTQLGDYVIVHELLHFSVPNHGKLWKMLMRAHLGDWEKLEQRLTDSAISVPSRGLF